MCFRFCLGRCPHMFLFTQTGTSGQHQLNGMSHILCGSARVHSSTCGRQAVLVQQCQIGRPEALGSPHNCAGLPGCHSSVQCMCWEAPQHAAHVKQTLMRPGRRLHLRQQDACLAGLIPLGCGLLTSTYSVILSQVQLLQFTGACKSCGCDCTVRCKVRCGLLSDHY